MSTTHFEQVRSRSGLAAEHGYASIAASALRGRLVLPFPPDMPLFIFLDVAATEIAPLLEKAYGREHPSVCWQADLTETQLRVADLNNCPAGWLFLPARPSGYSLESFQNIIARLRAPDGCPWDQKQTHLSLRHHLLEEAYETLDALDAEQPEKMREEFGDLLLQVVLHAQIATDLQTFTLNDVLKSIHDKIIRRHPHVFGTTQVDGVDAVLQNWEQIKASERAERGDEEHSLLDGLPRALPALSQAQELQVRAARVGFDWEDTQGVLDKIREEIIEVDEARTNAEPAELEQELGDLLFALVNLARWCKVDAEQALRLTNAKFRKRFAHIERTAKKTGRALETLTLEEMEALWQEAKSL
jgi:tetrapyrrole methylase family protein / MazG family protein